jgi:hypothetical protein
VSPHERTVDGEPVAQWVAAVEFRTSLGQPVDCQSPEAHSVRGLPVVCEEPGHATGRPPAAEAKEPEAEADL